MGDARERELDALVVARCLAGERGAWERLARVFGPEFYSAVARRWRRHGRPSADIIEDAMQVLFCDLLRRPRELLGDFGKQHVGLRAFLIRLTCRTADRLLRKEQRRRRHEAKATVIDAEPEQACEDYITARAKRLVPVLTLSERERLRSLLDRTLSDGKHRLSEAAWEHFKRRVREKLRRQDAQDAQRRREEKSGK